MNKQKKYTYSLYSIKKINKNDFVLSRELNNKINREQLINKMKEVLTNRGLVYFVTINKIVYGLAIVGFDRHLDLEEKTNDSIKKGKDYNAYILKDFYLDSSLTDDSKNITNDLIELLKDKANFSSLYIKEIIWKHDVIKTDSSTKTNSIAIGMCLGMAVGTCIGLLFDKMVYGMLFGLSIGIMAGLIFGKYKTNNKEN